jgi:hypothetical protein
MFFGYQFLVISELLLALAPVLIPILLVAGAAVLSRRRLGRSTGGDRGSQPAAAVRGLDKRMRMGDVAASRVLRCEGLGTASRKASSLR